MGQLTDTERRQLALERQLYNILSDLWDHKDSPTGGLTYRLYVDMDMAERIRNALGVTD